MGESSTRQDGRTQVPNRVWAWSVTSALGHVRGITDDQVKAADWVQMLLARTPGHATASISGPGLDGPVRIGSTDGAVYSLEPDNDGH